MLGVCGQRLEGLGIKVAGENLLLYGNHSDEAGQVPSLLFALSLLFYGNHTNEAGQVPFLTV